MAAVVVGAVLVVLATRPAAAPTNALTLPPGVYSADQTSGASLGSKSAPVVIQIYADFQCPACRQLITQGLPRLVADFVTPGVVRLEAQDVDFLGSGAANESLELAAGAYCAAQQNRYWQYHDLVFWNQGRENRGDHSTAFITRVADQAGVDDAAWASCFQRTDIRQPIADRSSSALAQGIDSTPTLIVNGQKIVGVPDYGQLSSLITQLAAAVASPRPS